MKMQKYIEMGEERAGKQIELARLLDVSDGYIRMVKGGKRGLPDALCIKLADYIGVDRIEIIAASNLVTEKDEKRRKIYESCFKKTSKAAGITAAAIVISILTLAPITPTGAALNGKTNNNIHY
jgi:plasmid maintenance system antidote protein VapI